ncbi:PE domain-containing protein [Nocardia sp. CA2R105]|uniref:PE domain-containing protein n=1 Tax=Nocardia coffeae TaxID=2873381 RepID=UPI001CA6D388|nr:PE domain-containing protein [Nocardia coffeae]MBY8862755.1 PE domain-containing protein [Nocardia coffeae]
MSLEVTPEHLPVISGQLGAVQSSAVQTIAAGAPISVAAPPGCDVVSALIPAATFAHAVAFFPSALEMVGCGAEASAVLPVIAVDYVVTDLFGGTSVAAQSIFPE